MKGHPVTHAEHVQRIKALNPNLTVMDRFVNSTTKLRYKCKRCKVIVIRKPPDVYRWPTCGSCMRLDGHPNKHSDEQYVERALRVNTSLAEVMDVYEGMGVPIRHKWSCGCITVITPMDVIRGNGCNSCRRATSNDYEGWLARNQPNLIALEPFAGEQGKILHQCKSCDYRWRTCINNIRTSVYRGTLGCPLCGGHKASKAGTHWLDSLEKKLRLKIKREHRIVLGSQVFYADGYNAHTNTIYEFYGSAFHGNPKLFKPDDRCNPFNRHVTAAELLKATRTRECRLRAAGFNLVSVWDTEIDRRVS